jgi:hypothetical protein
MNKRLYCMTTCILQACRGDYRQELPIFLTSEPEDGEHVIFCLVSAHVQARA